MYDKKHTENTDPFNRQSCLLFKEEVAQELALHAVSRNGISLSTNSFASPRAEKLVDLAGHSCHRAIPNFTPAQLENILEAASDIRSRHGCNAVLALILAKRGFIAGQELEQFLNPSIALELQGPLPKNFRKAISILKSAIKNRAPIALVHDFDVDGCTSAVILLRALRSVGAAVESYAPDRFEDGYGLCARLVREIAKTDAKVLIVLDMGSTNHKEIALARQLNLKVIVIDHHERPAIDWPMTDAFINPKQDRVGPYTPLSTGALVWKLCDETGLAVQDLLPLAAAATIADVVKLTGPARAFVKSGLNHWQTGNHPGLRALEYLSKIEAVDSEDIAFGLAPRLNAPGRVVVRKDLGITGGDLVTNLLATDDQKHATSLAGMLDGLNEHRKQLEKDCLGLAFEQLRSRYTPEEELPGGLVVWHKELHAGVVGLVAARLAERFRRPALVLREEADGSYKGSGRSIPGFDLLQALKTHSKYLQNFGGHTSAAGLTVRPGLVAQFSKEFGIYAEQKTPSEARFKTFEPDFVVTLEYLVQHGEKILRDLKALNPFGPGNRVVNFEVQNAGPYRARVIKGKHLELGLRQGGTSITGFMWHTTSHPLIEHEKTSVSPDRSESAVGPDVTVICRPFINRQRQFGAAGNRIMLHIEQLFPHARP